MLKNYFLIAFRNIKRNKGISLINIVGLAIGLGLFILISLYVGFEFGFDKFHKNYKNIYRVEMDFDGKGRLVGITFNGMVKPLVNDYPEIEEAVRFINMGGQQSLVIDENNIFPQLRGLWAENSIFSVFSFNLIQGNPETVLSESYSIVLTKELANQIFPNENPVGKTIRLNNEADYKITGIVADCPENSHIQFQFLTSFNTQNDFYGAGYTESWNRGSCYTYVRLNGNADLEQVNAKIKNLFQIHVDESIPSLVYLKPLSDIHFHSNVLGEFGPVGDLKQVNMSLVVGLFVLLIACINFMNLSTARSTQRAKEVGLRKVIGANKSLLIRQFLSESIVFTLISMLLAFVLAELLLKPFNTVIGRDLSIDIFKNWSLLFKTLIITLIVGFFSGSYPALFLSSFQPVKVLKVSFHSGSRSVLVRKSLVVFQFAISIFLIFVTITIARQMHFMKTQDLGLNTEYTLIMNIRDAQPQTIQKCNLYQKEILNIPGIQNTTVSRFTPTFNGAATVVHGWEGSADGDETYININWIDHRYLDSYGIEILSGRNFFDSDTESEIDNCIINETAAKRFGWTDPVGKTYGGTMTIIGMVKDFHFASLRYKIEPLVLYNIHRPGINPRIGNSLSIRISATNIPETISSLEKQFDEIFPGETFQYQFLDEQMERVYTAERRTSKTVAYLSIIAIFIACLGLFGLASYTIEQHTKEIGIRKVLGSTVAQNVFLFTKEYAKWVLIANLIAWPLAGLAMQKWLQDFAYRTQLSAWIFLLSGFIALFIAIITVSWQTIRAALADPVKSLRYE